MKTSGDKLKYNKIYYAKTKDERLSWQKKYYVKQKRENSLHQMFLRIKSRAKKKGIEFNIEESDIIIPTVCPILNIPLYHKPGYKGRNTPSVDRVDSSKGYIKGNIAVISSKANAIKSDMTLEEARRLVAYMEHHLEKEIL